MTRFKLLTAIIATGSAAVAIAHLRSAEVAAQRLSWIATASQLGPVGYRDPAGAVSPDGRWIAYSGGRFLRVRLIGGGPGLDFQQTTQIRNVAWSPNSQYIVTDGYGSPTGWGRHDIATARSEPLETRGLRQLSWMPDGTRVVGVANTARGNELRVVSVPDGKSLATPVGVAFAFPAATPKGEVACIATTNGRPRVTLPCGGAPLRAHPQRNAYGPIAFSRDGSIVYVSLANDAGTVDLWSIPISSGTARQLTFFARDTYAPSVAADGSVVFKVQNYRTHVAAVESAGGRTFALATFQSETPSWDPTGRLLGITYGTWRRVPDDANYPDIAQDAGIIAVDRAHPAPQPSSIVHDSLSEDQSLCWSPNGQWIAFHSHKEMSDDIWLRRASGDPTAKRISMLGRGAEVGWPRWSRDGKWLLFDGENRETGRSVIYLVGLDQTTGAITVPVREVPVTGFEADVFHAEWIDGGETIAAVAKEGPGRHLIFTVPRTGGAANVVHRYTSEHDVPGLGVSADGRQLAFVAPAPDGYFQVFRIPATGGAPSQVTLDPSHKTQPAWSPDGKTIAFTVWSYDAQFWRIDGR